MKQQQKQQHHHRHQQTIGLKVFQFDPIKVLVFEAVSLLIVFFSLAGGMCANLLLVLDHVKTFLWWWNSCYRVWAKAEL